MNTIAAIGAVNALLSLSINSLVAMQKINQIIAQAQSENRDITEAEWQSVIADADAADKRLADAINSATG